MPWEEGILALLGRESTRPLLFDELLAALRFEGEEEGKAAEAPAESSGPAPEHAQVKLALEALERRGAIVRTRSDRYGLPARMNLVVGRLQGNARGFGFVVPDDPSAADVYVGSESLNGAWHGDRVIARLLPGSGGGRAVAGRPGGQGPAGEIIRILERANQRVVGTFHIGAGAGFVTPDDRRLPEDILIPDPASTDAQDGETVVVEVQRFPDGRRGPLGQVVERLGFKGDPGVDVLAIIRRFGLPEEFPADVLAEAEATPAEVGAGEIAGREDLRGLPMVTIDGEDAKDLDDAVSLERTHAGNYRLGVHIADVSHYVREGSALDREALHRGTSVYLVDRVIPMLPHRLSNGICSLNPQVERLAVSVFMDFDPDGRPMQHRIARTVIRTAERMTYTNVARILVERDRTLIERYRDLVPMFVEMDQLTRLLRARRRRRGSIDFDLQEEKVVLDPAGRPVDVRTVVRTVADQIIEEFMLRANETVAEEFFQREVPFVYRIHEEPAPDEMAELAEFLGGFGIHLKRRKQTHPKALQEVLEQIAGRPEEKLLSTVILRSMKQARYAAENVGHFGLAAPYYTHFTSPIRRYPDLQIHRIITWLLENQRLTSEREERWTASLPEAAAHCSAMERRADDAERDTVNLKKAEYMLDRVGEEFDGLISGVTHFGIFVQLANMVEGLVHVSHMADDYYEYLEGQHALLGRHRRRMYRLGDPVRVRVTAVNVEEARVDFELVGEAAETGVPSRRQTGEPAGRNGRSDREPARSTRNEPGRSTRKLVRRGRRPAPPGKAPEKIGEKRKRR